MFSIPLLLVSTLVVAALAAPLLETINPALVTSSLHFGTSFLNSTALMEADASARVASLADVQIVDSSHVSLLTPQRNTTIGEIEDLEYTVPGTQTTLHVSFREDRPLHRRSIGGYLLLMQDEVQAHINASGDGWLLPEDDPYRRKWPGFYFISKSSPLPASEGEHHLTYGIMDNVLKGLFDVMYVGVPGAGPLPFGCYCNIADGTEDLVGTVAIWAAPT